MKTFFQTILAALIGGAVTGAAGALTSGGNWSTAGKLAGAGAVVGVAGLFTKKPGSDATPVSNDTPSIKG